MSHHQIIIWTTLSMEDWTQTRISSENRCCVTLSDSIWKVATDPTLSKILFIIFEIVAFHNQGLARRGIRRSVIVV